MTSAKTKTKTETSHAADGRADELETVPGDHLNEVSMRGRIGRAPTVRVLPSGDELVTFRLVMSRGTTSTPLTPMTSGSRQRSDWVDCAVLGGRVRRSARTWAADDEVEVRGVLRRRFYRTGNGVADTRVEIEVLAGRRVTRRA